MDARQLALPLYLITLTLGACGGGGGTTPAPAPNPAPNPAPEPEPEVSTAKHFVYVNKDSGELFMVTDDNLNAPVSLATNISAYQLITAWDYDLDTRTLSNFDFKSALYAKDGKIYKADLTAEPASVQVSSESNYCPVSTDNFEFGSISVGGFDQAGASWSGYTSAGADGLCGTADDQPRLIKLSMTVDDAPVTPPGLELTDLFNEGTGLLDGWLLANNSGQLIRSDADFQANTAIAGAPASTQWSFVESTGSTQLLLDGDTQTLYQYDSATGSFDVLANNFVYSSALIDSTAFYWLDPRDNLIKKVALDGSGIADTLAPNTASLEDLTENYLIFRSNDNGHYFSVLKTGGTAIDVFAPTDAGTLIAGPGDLLYINNFETALSNSRVSAHIAQASNGHIELNLGHAHWAGVTAADTLSLDADNPFQAANILLIQHGTTADNWTDYQGGTLVSYEAATMNQLGDIGTIPATVRVDGLYGLSASTLFISSTLPQELPTNVFYMNSNGIGSLSQITHATTGQGFDASSL